MTQWLAKVVAGGSEAWEELVEPKPSPSYRFGRTTASCQRAFRIPYSQITNFLAECFPSVGGIPGQHPTFPYLFVDDLVIEASDAATFSQAGTLAIQAPDMVVVDVTYTPLEIDLTAYSGGDSPPGSDPFDLMTDNISFTSETMSIPGYSLNWESSGEPIKNENVRAFAIISIMEYAITLPRVAFIPWAAIRECLNKVNQSIFWGGDSETVLYAGPQVARRFSSSGQWQFDVSHHFREKRINWQSNVYGWNHVWNPEPGYEDFDKPVTSGGGTLYLPTDSFSDLLRRA